MLGSIIGAASSLIGGLLGKDSQDEQIEAQREFAQNGIRWRVADANAAGVHPLYALGANTHSFSPIGVGGGLGEGVAAAGQEIGRAISSKQTQPERLYNEKVMQLTLQRGELENQLLASQIARINTPTQQPPAMPRVGPSVMERFGLPGHPDNIVQPDPARFGGTIDGAGPLVLNVPLERMMDPDAPFREPGAVAETGWAVTPGGMAPVPSQDVQDRMEDVFGPDIAWSWRNIIMPNFVRQPEKLPPAPAGMQWEWSIFDQEYKLVKR